MQFWLACEEDQGAALERYVNLCKLGGNAPFQTLVAQAGLISPFTGGCLVCVVNAARLCFSMSQTPLKQIEFYFDFACPYAYLASTRLTGSAPTQARRLPSSRCSGRIFRSLEQPQNMSTTLSPARARHNRLDLLRWASWLEAPCRRRCGTPTGRSRRCVVCSLRRPRRRSASMPSTPCIGVTPPTLATFRSSQAPSINWGWTAKRSSLTQRVSRSR